MRTCNPASSARGVFALAFLQLTAVCAGAGLSGAHPEASALPAPEPTVSAIMTGTGHSLYLRTDGSLWGFGRNSYGQTGDGMTEDRSVPFQITSEVITAAGGLFHTAYVKTNGSLWTFGDNSSGQLGNGKITASKVPLQVATGVESVALGDSSTLFIKSDASLWGIGSNRYGQLGDGTTSERHLPISISSGVSSVACGVGHTAFVKTDGTLWVMGWNTKGQLGTGDTSNRKSPVKVAEDVEAVSAGKYHTLFLKDDGELWGMGTNEWKQLGGTANQPSPVLIASGVIDMDAGDYHTMFVTSDHTLWVMGSNSYGQLGNGTRVSQVTPVAIASNVAAVSAGEVHSLYLKLDGSVWATGSNTFGQLGDGTETLRTRPVRIAGPVSSVSTLSGLTLSAGNLSPSFTGGTTVYSATVPNTTTSLQVTPQAGDPVTIKVNGAPVAAGSPSGTIALAVGKTTLTVVVTAEDGISTTSYQVVVTRPPSSVSTLSRLALSGGTLSPVFNPARLTYTAKVPYKTKSLKVTPSATSTVSKVKVNGVAVPSATASKAIALKIGKNTLAVVVTAQDGTVRTYKVVVTRAAKPKSSAPRPLDFAAPVAPGLQGAALVTLNRAEGVFYRSIDVPKLSGPASGIPVVEVSPNLVDWYSGAAHTTVSLETATFVRVRDNIPLSPGAKRYIRIKP